MATLNDVITKLRENIDNRTRKVGNEWYSFTGKVPVGGVPYYGQEVTRATYSDLWTWVKEQGLVNTESEWQALNTSQRGNVPFYSSGDGSTTFRMPKVVGYIKGASSQSEAGSYVAEGLPNITSTDLSGGLVCSSVWSSSSTEREEQGGALYVSKAGNSEYTSPTAWNEGVAARRPYGLCLDASRSNSIYGNSEHVTPETSTVLFGVYAF